MEANQSGVKKILIADDEPSVRSLVKKLLGKSYIVLEANDGEEAVNMALNQKPDLILMDILMPKMDGLTACYAIKANQATKAIPVVMLTAVDYELNKKLSRDIIGAHGYITKPFNSQDLMKTIGQFL
ncbi:MAG: response regulator [Dehalococcoidales bacterium]|nr:response regulator [Dehalococcoidales bacterium]